MPWKDWQHDIERQFNPRAWATDVEEQHALRGKLSKAARERLKGTFDIAYGDTPRQKLDIYHAGNTRAPIVVYLHGGYWRVGEKEKQAILAEPLVQAGFPVVMLGTDLCPAVTLDIIVEQVIRGIVWTANNAQRVGGDARRIYLYGHSAGAHLAAMGLAEDWTKHGLPADLICGATMVSGIYDVEPVLHISVNDLIRLTADRVHALSPQFYPPRRGVPVVLAAGGEEAPGWVAQTTEYAEVCRNAGCKVEVIVVPHEGHFSTIPMQADLAHPINVAMIRDLKALG
ncbi:MAG: alpha/beta hydrolase [Betaproteobacteria bacterium]|nr:alpha/beta hydrolase [Betaproteobacteria bacterium]